MTRHPDEPPVLAVHGVHKIYSSGTHALRGVDMAVRPGSVHGLIGANGAGKSTLIRILSGAEVATSGTVQWKGETVRWTTPGHARAVGLAAVHQHTPLVPTLPVLDNVFLGPSKAVAWNEDARLAELERLLDRLGYSLDPMQPVGELAVGARQMVAILQALARDPSLVLLDEPTAALSPAERTVLFRSVRRLQEQGTTFVYVSHFLDEVLDLTGHLTVLRDGAVVIDAATADTTKQDLVSAIVGKRLAAVEAVDSHPPTNGEPLLEVDDLLSPGRFGPVSFRVNSGEVVGIAGLLGSGRTELLEAIFGADRAATGRVRLAGRSLGRRSPQKAVRRGLALVPEDRNRQGLFREWSIRDNVSLPYLSSLARRRCIPSERAEQDVSERAISDLAIKAGSADTLVGELSGGNAQKVVFAKWVYGPARVFLLDEPAAGVDVGAKADIIQLVRRLAADGKGVLLVASEFEELLAACDRVIVMRRGQLIGERATADTDLHELTALASGL